MILFFAVYRRVVQIGAIQWKYERRANKVFK